MLKIKLKVKFCNFNGTLVIQIYLDKTKIAATQINYGFFGIQLGKEGGDHECKCMHNLDMVAVVQ